MASSITTTTTPFDSLQVGDVVSLTYHTRQVLGIVRFAGTTDFAGVPLVGVELSYPAGRCDGARDGRDYFQTESTLTLCGAFLSARTAAESGLQRVGSIVDGGGGGAAADGSSSGGNATWARFPRHWNDQRAAVPEQFVLRILHTKFPLVQEVGLHRGWCVTTEPMEDQWGVCWSDNIEVLQQVCSLSLAFSAEPRPISAACCFDSGPSF